MKESLGSVAPRAFELHSFAERFAGSEQFEQIFRDGMSLVERTSRYLDGPGRREAKALTASANIIYASESMRLTTRLLEIASWLLLRRSLGAGEITLEEARVRRRRIRLSAIGRPGHVRGFSQLPQGLQALIEESFTLNDRIVWLDRSFETTSRAVGSSSDNPVGAQIDALSVAFGRAKA